MNPDILNALFEIGGAFLTMLSVLRLHKDKRIRGLHPAPVIFFTAWGFWNFIIYYPQVGHLFSTIAAFVLTAVNIVWLFQMYYYRKN